MYMVDWCTDRWTLRMFRLDRDVGPCYVWWTYRQCEDRWTFRVFRLDRAIYGGLIVSDQTIGHCLWSTWTVLMDRTVYGGLVSLWTIGLHVCPAWTVLYMADHWTSRMSRLDCAVYGGPLDFTYVPSGLCCIWRTYHECADIGH